MIDSRPPTEEPATPENPSLEEILRPGPHGALVVAGIATLVVVAIWLLFYLLVFLPRGAVP